MANGTDIADAAKVASRATAVLATFNGGNHPNGGRRKRARLCLCQRSLRTIQVNILEPRVEGPGSGHIAHSIIFSSWRKKANRCWGTSKCRQMYAAAAAAANAGLFRTLRWMTQTCPETTIATATVSDFLLTKRQANRQTGPLHAVKPFKPFVSAGHENESISLARPRPQRKDIKAKNLSSAEKRRKACRRYNPRLGPGGLRIRNTLQPAIPLPLVHRPKCNDMSLWHSFQSLCTTKCNAYVLILLVVVGGGGGGDASFALAMTAAGML